MVHDFHIFSYIFINFWFFSICKTDNDVGFIESLYDAHVIRSIQDGNTYWRVVLLFADGNMIIQDYKQISQQREDREVELTGQWHINSILQESKSNLHNL